jgi:hypothetical protein
LEEFILPKTKLELTIQPLNELVEKSSSFVDYMHQSILPVLEQTLLNSPADILQWLVSEATVMAPSQSDEFRERMDNIMRQAALNWYQIVEEKLADQKSETNLEYIDDAETTIGGNCLDSLLKKL